MNIDQIEKQDERIALVENTSKIKKMIKDLMKMPWNKAKSFMKSKFTEFVKFSQNNGIEQDVLDIINKLVHGKYRRLRDVMTEGIKKSTINEANWWEEAKGSAFGAASFYPLLQAFLELDKVVKSTGDASMSYVGAYGLIWASIISAKVLKDKVISKEPKKKKAYDTVGKAYMEM